MEEQLQKLAADQERDSLADLLRQAIADQGYATALFALKDAVEHADAPIVPGLRTYLVQCLKDMIVCAEEGDEPF